MNSPNSAAHAPPGPPPTLPFWANLALPAILWGGLFLQLTYEWAHNGQYSYGLFVPFLGIYLLHLRWVTRPLPQPRTTNRLSQHALIVLLTLVALAIYPIKIIFEANADWRLIIWIQTLLIFATTLLLLHHWGGWTWVRHFGIPLIFFLTAIPWPRWLEARLVLNLMEVVATATVETVNMLGIYAKQSGNIIMLKSGIVSVEEACSGVRSFQSTFMAAVFLGELMRFTALWRLTIIAVGLSLAIFYNYCRTLTLTLVTSSQGVEALEQWHDPAGYIVFILSFGSLAILCYLLRNIARTPSSPSAECHHPVIRTPTWLPLKPVAILSVFVLLADASVPAWYALRGPESNPDQVWKVDWNQGTYNLRFEKIDPAIQEILFYDEGDYLTWTTPNGYRWTAFFFAWHTAKAAQLGGVHNPEICLPAVGWSMARNYDEYIWHGPNALEMIFNVYRFENPRQSVYVFYCQWDPQQYPYHTKVGRFRKDRLRDSWIGDRKEGKRKLEIIIEGPDTVEKAQQALENFLEQAITSL